MPQLTVTETVMVEAPPEPVFDVTQDWSRRPTWDPAVLQTEVITDRPERVVEVTGRGGLTYRARSRFLDRPLRASFALSQSSAAWLTGGAETGEYALVRFIPDGKREECLGTRWTHTTTWILGPSGPHAWLAPLVRWRLGWDLRRAMTKAKKLIETGGAAPEAGSR